MAYPMRVLVNDFAIRSFRDTADKDYITARMAYRGRLIQPFRWMALHCLEKYVKSILLLNRVDAKDLKHSVLPGVERMKHRGKFEIDLSVSTINFIKNLEESGARDRYYLLSYDIEPFEIKRFDQAVWELRRYCQPLDYDFTDLNGKTMNMLSQEIERIKKSKENLEKGTCISSGVLENIIKKNDHPAREALIWKNLFFGPSRRKSVKMLPDWEIGNSPFFLNPEIIDEVAHYVNIPKDIAEGVRQFAKQKASKKVMK